MARIGLRYDGANATGVAAPVLPYPTWVNRHGLTQRRTTVNRNSDCSVVKASIRLGTVRGKEAIMEWLYLGITVTSTYTLVTLALILAFI